MRIICENCKETLVNCELICENSKLMDCLLLAELSRSVLTSTLLSLWMMYKTTYATQDNFYTPGHTPKDSQLALINSQVKHTWRGLKIKSRTLWRPVDTLQSHTRQKRNYSHVLWTSCLSCFSFFFINKSYIITRIFSIFFNVSWTKAIRKLVRY